MNKYLLIFTLISIPFLEFSQNLEQKIDKIDKKIDSLSSLKDKLYLQKEELKLAWVQEKMEEIGIPKKNDTLKIQDELIKHSAMILSYNEEHEQANWVMHIIIPDIMEGNTSRTNDFRIDKKVSTGSSEELDYFIRTMNKDSTFTYDGFGYDRGHLAPSADFRWSAKSLSESYFYSNMSPQKADFNQGKWAELEGWMREYVEENNTHLIIYTAPILKSNLPRIERAKNKPSIPNEYVKLAFDPKNKRGIAFLMPNTKIEKPIESFALSIDSIEKITGFNFYPNLSDSIQKRIEANHTIDFWLPKKEKGDVLALSEKQMPKNAINTYQVENFVGDSKNRTVCGTTVSIKKHEKGHVFINLDKKFPNQIFSVSIFKSSLKNFSYEPDIYLVNKKVCFTGKINEYNGNASMIIENEKAMEILK
jgi:endonuclease G